MGENGETLNLVKGKQKTFNRVIEEINEKLAGFIKDMIPVSESDKNALSLAQQTEFNEILKDINAEYGNFLKGNNEDKLVFQARTEALFDTLVKSQNELWKYSGIDD